MLKKLLFIGGAFVVLSGCSMDISETQNNNIENVSGEVNNSNSGLILTGNDEENTNISSKDNQINILTPDVVDELNTLYDTKLVFQKVNRLDNFIIADANDGTEQPDNGILIVVAKINNKWIKLYEGNSGEISCSLIEKYNFPKELLENCTPGADYTIPQESLPFANK